ncbi:MAG: phosphatidate cytidylyltransferase [Chloroflexota bacterium]|nr:phosphatidate cytidylyltransferase [Chloroflexota bacterium]
MSSLGARVLTAMVYGAVVLAAAFAPPPALALLVGLLALVAYAELARLFAAHPARPLYWGLLLVAALQVPRFFTGRDGWVDAGIWSLGLLAAAAAWRMRHRGGVGPRIAFSVAAAVYLGWLLGYLTDLGVAGSSHTARAGSAVPVWLFLALLPTWAGDVTAYAVGRAVGRRRLAPRISPGKTWEGTIAGFVAAAAAALGLAAYGAIPPVSAAIAVAALGPAALGGDLLESYLKRRAGAKDSGGLLPGHGGVLDRIDSLIAVAPLVAVALAAAGTVG